MREWEKEGSPASVDERMGRSCSRSQRFRASGVSGVEISRGTMTVGRVGKPASVLAQQGRFPTESQSPERDSVSADRGLSSKHKSETDSMTVHRRSPSISFHTSVTLDGDHPARLPWTCPNFPKSPSTIVRSTRCTASAGRTPALVSKH